MRFCWSNSLKLVALPCPASGSMHPASQFLVNGAVGEAHHELRANSTVPPSSGALASFMARIEQPAPDVQQGGWSDRRRMHLDFVPCRCASPIRARSRGRTPATGVIVDGCRDQAGPPTGAEAMAPMSPLHDAAQPSNHHAAHERDGTRRISWPRSREAWSSSMSLAGRRLIAGLVRQRRGMAPTQIAVSNVMLDRRQSSPQAINGQCLHAVRRSAGTARRRSRRRGSARRSAIAHWPQPIRCASSGTTETALGRFHVHPEQCAADDTRQQQVPARPGALDASIERGGVRPIGRGSAPAGEQRGRSWPRTA